MIVNLWGRDFELVIELKDPSRVVSSPGWVARLSLIGWDHPENYWRFTTTEHLLDSERLRSHLMDAAVALITAERTTIEKIKPGDSMAEGYKVINKLIDAVTELQRKVK